MESLLSKLISYICWKYDIICRQSLGMERDQEAGKMGGERIIRNLGFSFLFISCATVQKGVETLCIQKKKKKEVDQHS